LSRKHILNSFQVIEDGDMSGDLTTKVTNVEQEDLIRYTVEWAGTGLIGTFSVEISDNDVNFQPLEFDTSPTIDGDTGAHTLNINIVNFKFSRLVYTFTAGTGTLQAFVKAHTLGT